MPLNHLGGRIPLSSAFQAGGTSYFVPESDLSTLFEDWSLVRPTDVGLVPRVVEMLFQRYQQGVQRLVAQGVDEATAEDLVNAELREKVLGGRVLGGFVSTAPLSAEMKSFIESCLDADMVDAYGLTEIGAVTTDGVVVRPLVIDYKLDRRPGTRVLQHRPAAPPRRTAGEEQRRHPRVLQAAGGHRGRVRRRRVLPHR